MSRVVTCRACGRFYEAHSQEQALGRLCLACKAEGVRALRGLLFALLLGGAALLVIAVLIAVVLGAR